MAKVIVHIDLNAFFVRAEEIKDPSLEGKPVAIGGSGRSGIISTCSYKAREYGVSSGMPTFKALQLCPKLILINGDYRFYNLLSATFMKFVRNYTPYVEIGSCDECYADFTERVKNEKDVVSFFKNMQNELYQKTKLKCSIGVGPTKFIAKMGSDYKKPMGLTIIHRRDIKNILYPLSVDKVFGIGKKTYPKLIEEGIKTYGDLVVAIQNNDARLYNLIGSYRDDLLKNLLGYGSDTISIEREDNKSIGHSETLPYDTSDFDVIEPFLNGLCLRVSKRAKRDSMIGSTIQIVAKETAKNGFKIHNKSCSLTKLTNDYRVIKKVALDLYEKSFPNLEVRMVGVTLQNLVSVKDATIQMSLFDEDNEQVDNTYTIIDDINKKMNKTSLMMASDIKGKRK